MSLLFFDADESLVLEKNRGELPSSIAMVYSQFKDPVAQTELAELQQLYPPGGNSSWIERCDYLICNVAPKLIPLATLLVEDPLSWNAIQYKELSNSESISLISNVGSYFITASLNRLIPRIVPELRLNPAGNSLFPDFIVRCLTYPGLPLKTKQSRKVPCMTAKGGPSNVPDGVELKVGDGTPHMPHCGLHLDIDWCITDDRLAIIDVLLAWIRLCDHKDDNAGKSSSTTPKYEYSGVKWISLYRDNIIQKSLF